MRIFSRNKNIISIVFLWVALLIVLTWSLFPIIMTYTTSFKMRNIAFKIPPVWIFKPVLDNYKNVFARTEFSKNFLNSVTVTAVSTLISITLGSLAAYSFARFNFVGRTTFLLFLLATRMLPPIALSIPIFLLGRMLNLIDTKIILIVAYTALNLPFAIWFMYGFFKIIPTEIDDAAMIDGCGRLKAFFRIILPLTSPGLVAASIFCILLSWKDFLLAFMLTGSKTKTLSVAIAGFSGSEGIEWGNLCAAASIIIFPVLIFSIIVRKYMVRGMTMGALQ